MNLRKILTHTIIWRLILFALPLLIVNYSEIFTILGNFHGSRFLNIAKVGYGTPDTYYSYSLFPFYPHLIRSLSPLFGYFASGLIISNICMFLSIFIFWKLLRLDYKPSTSYLALVCLALFPASFFLGSMYSESLFLFLSLASFYAARRGNFFVACLFAFFATYTRAAGILLWISLVIEYFSQNRFSKNTFTDPKIYYLAFPPLGTYVYLKYLSIYTNSITNFLPSIPEKLILLHQIFLRYFKMLIFVDHTSPLFLTVMTEIFTGALVLFVIIFSHKFLRMSYWSYLTLSYFIPTFWGSFVGYPRYMLVAFPLFIYLAHWLEKSHPYYMYLYLFFSSILLVINLLLFSQGIFVG